VPEGLNGRASSPANPRTNCLHRVMRHFSPNHATDFFKATDFVSRRVVVPGGALDFIPRQARAKVHSRTSVCKEPSRIFAALVGGQAPEVVGMDEICRFARLRLSGCHSDSASNVFGRSRPGRSFRTRPLSSQPALGPNLTIPEGLETPYLNGQSRDLSGCSSTGGRSRVPAG
jgi:hypothetical protein